MDVVSLLGRILKIDFYWRTKLNLQISLNSNWISALKILLSGRAIQVSTFTPSRIISQMAYYHFRIHNINRKALRDRNKQVWCTWWFFLCKQNISWTKSWEICCRYRYWSSLYMCRLFRLLLQCNNCTCWYCISYSLYCIDYII